MFSQSIQKLSYSLLLSSALFITDSAKAMDSEGTTKVVGTKRKGKATAAPQNPFSTDSAKAMDGDGTTKIVGTKKRVKKKGKESEEAQYSEALKTGLAVEGTTLEDLDGKVRAERSTVYKDLSDKGAAELKITSQDLVLLLPETLVFDYTSKGRKNLDAALASLVREAIYQKKAKIEILKLLNIKEDQLIEALDENNDALRKGKESDLDKLLSRATFEYNNKLDKLRNIYFDGRYYAYIHEEGVYSEAVLKSTETQPPKKDGKKPINTSGIFRSPEEEAKIAENKKAAGDFAAKRKQLEEERKQRISKQEERKKKKDKAA